MEHKEQLDRIEDTVDKAGKAIFGNGSEGLIARTARIEERLISAAENSVEAKEISKDLSEKTDKNLSKLTDNLTSLTQNVIRLTDSVNIHHGTEHLSELMKKKSFWLLIFIGLIAMHMIATYVPNVWDGAMMLLGLPKLVLPLPAG